MNVRDFLTKVYAAHNRILRGSPSYRDDIYFRGHGNGNWEILPLLFRTNVYLEHQFLENAQNILWQELQQVHSSIERLIFFQHYGLPTRLLDVTRNPLVALFFACEKQIDKEGRELDGAVLYGFENDKNASINEVEMICDIPFAQEIQCIQPHIRGLDLYNPDNLRMVTTMYFINPPLNNPRIIAQNGAFLFSPLLTKDNLTKNLLLNNSHLSAAFQKKKIVIPACDKENLKRELMDYGIHEGSLFPDIEHKMSYIKRLTEAPISRILIE